MAGSIDLTLLRNAAHGPSAFAPAQRASVADLDLVDFSRPCNSYFPTPEMFEQLSGSLEAILTHRPSDAETIVSELCCTLGLNPQTVAMGNGSTELTTWIDHLLVRESLAIPIPTSGRWTGQPMGTGKRVDMFPLAEEQGFQLDVDKYIRFIRLRGSRVAVVCNPNNPDGGYLPRCEILRLLDGLMDLDLVIVDESFVDFAGAEPETSVAAEAALRHNVIVLKSLGDNLGLHGVGFGYLIANPALAGTIRQALPKGNLNAFAEFVVRLLKDHQSEYRASLQLIAQDRLSMIQQLAALPGLTVFPSQGGFVMVKLPDGAGGVALRDYLLAEHGVLVRECGDRLGVSSRFVRLAVRPQREMQRLLTGLGSFLYRTENTPSLYAVDGLHDEQGRPATVAAPPGAAVPGSGSFGPAPGTAPAPRYEGMTDADFDRMTAVRIQRPFAEAQAPPVANEVPPPPLPPTGTDNGEWLYR